MSFNQTTLPARGVKWRRVCEREVLRIGMILVKKVEGCERGVGRVKKKMRSTGWKRSQNKSKKMRERDV